VGYSLSWVAFRNRSSDEVRAELGFTGTTDYSEIPEGDLLGAELPSGWSLLLANDDERFIDEQLLEIVSKGCDAVACWVEEHSMVSAASGWKSGFKLWSVEHDSSKGLDDLRFMGMMPPEWDAIRQRLEAERKTNDADVLFDAPVELAKALVGFRHDEDVPHDGCDVFQLLEEGGGSGDDGDGEDEAAEEPAAEGEKKSFWKKLFG
jgi:hypothetical protein